MKTIFRNLALGVLMTGISAIGATTTFAQDVCTEVEAKQTLYAQFTSNFDKKEIEKRKVAIEAGEQYVQKYGACADDKAIVDYLNTNIPAMKKAINDSEEKAKRAALLNRFDTAVKGTNKVANPAETYAAGKEIAALNNDLLLDVLLVLGSAGYDQASATTPVDTYNNDTIEYAKMAIQKLEANATSKTGNYGVYQYSYKNDKFADGKPNPNGFADGKSNALGAMNYNIGYILYYRQGKDNPEKKKEGLSYLYKSLQYNSFTKKNPFIYQTIGAWYLDEALRIDKERLAAIKAAGDKDTPETLAMYALSKGYADRSIDAYARAYKIAKDDKESKKEYVDGLYTKLKDLYTFRYDGKTTGIEEFVSTVQSKPLPDPTTAVTPVVEEVPAPTTPTTTTTNTTTPATTKPTTPATTKPTTPATNTTNTTKPATTTPTKPVSQTTTPTDAANTAATTRPKTVKTTPKKKGTR